MLWKSYIYFDLKAERAPLRHAHSLRHTHAAKCKCIYRQTVWAEYIKGRKDAGGLENVSRFNW